MTTNSVSSLSPRPLCEQQREPSQKNGQFVIMGGRFCWLSSEEIKKKRQRGEPLIADIELIWKIFIALIDKGNEQTLDDLQAQPDFLREVGDYIQRHPHKAADHPSLANLGKTLSMWDKCSRKLGSREHSLATLFFINTRRDSLDSKAILRFLKSLPAETRASILAERTELLSYYDKESFLDDLEVKFFKEGKTIGLSENQWNVFIRLIEKGHWPTLEEFQSQADFQLIAKDYLQQHPQLAKEHTVWAKLQKVMEVLDHCPVHFTDQTKFISAAAVMWPAQVHQFLEFLPVEIRAAVLAERTDFLSSYYENRSFLVDCKVHFSGNGKSSGLSDNKWRVFIELVDSYHRETLSELQAQPDFRLMVRKHLEHNPQVVQQHPAWKGLERALDILEHSPWHWKSEISFLSVLLYIENKRNKMQSGAIGEDSTRQPGMKKIKASVSLFPYSITYDPLTKNAIYIQHYWDEGSFKVLKKVLDLRSLQAMALSKEEIKNRESVEKEVEMMWACKGVPHVVQIYEASYYTSKRKGLFQVVSSHFCNAGTLKDPLKELSEADKWQVASDILVGVMNLHAKGIVHRDLKPENILLDIEGDPCGVPRAVIIDLGFACWIDRPDPDRNILRGTSQYIAPEVWERCEANIDNDAWAVGLILSELFFGCLPYVEYPAERASFPQRYRHADRQLQEKYLDVADQLQNKKEPADRHSIPYVIWKLTRPNRKERMKLAEAWSVINWGVTNARSSRLSS